MLANITPRTLWAGTALCLAIGVAAVSAQDTKDKAKAQQETDPVGYSDTPVLPNQKWKVHDIDRPRPTRVTPGATPGAAPSDAIVLFNGKDMSHWESRSRATGQMEPARWKVMNGYMEVSEDSGDIYSREKFGDAQIHVEWAAPEAIQGASQNRGNSGILIMGRYEIQVLDSWDNLTYADGQAGAIYGQWPPMVNAAKRPGEWQTYDIIFEAPKFEDGKLVKPAYATVIHNGIVLHHHQEIIGAMVHRRVAKYTPHEAEAPLGLQNHHTKVRYRNIWVRPLKGYDQQ